MLEQAVEVRRVQDRLDAIREVTVSSGTREWLLKCATIQAVRRKVDSAMAGLEDTLATLVHALTTCSNVDSYLTLVSGILARQSALRAARHRIPADPLPPPCAVADVREAVLRCRRMLAATSAATPAEPETILSGERPCAQETFAAGLHGVRTAPSAPEVLKQIAAADALLTGQAFSLVVTTQETTGVTPPGRSFWF